MPQDTLRPIETFYRGNRFRSRLEARWAVFFHTLGVKYIHEHQGFNTNSGYLPDFRLLREQRWVEIKAIEPSGLALQNVYQFSQAVNQSNEDGESNDTFWMIVGDPYPEEYDVTVYHKLIDGSMYVIVQCPLCLRLSIVDLVPTLHNTGGPCSGCSILCEWCLLAGEGRLPDTKHVFFRDSLVSTYPRSCLIYSPKILAAYKAARSARFETPPRRGRRKR